jgi:anti-anti-sigma factor
MLNVTVKNVGDAAVLHCVGRIVAGEAGGLRDAVMRQANKSVVVLDLTEVGAIDAAGLGLLISLQTVACTVGFDLKLMNPAKHVQELLATTKLDSVFEIGWSRGESAFSRDVADTSAG